MSKIINCTPHGIIICGTTFQPSGIIPRVETVEIESCSINGFDCIEQKTGEVIGLPEPEIDTFLIVSGMVFQASDRTDLLAPDTGKTAIRNDQGQIIAVTRFLRK